MTQPQQYSLVSSQLYLFEIKWTVQFEAKASGTAIRAVRENAKEEIEVAAAAEVKVATLEAERFHLMSLKFLLFKSRLMMYPRLPPMEIRLKSPLSLLMEILTTVKKLRRPQVVMLRWVQRPPIKS